MVDFTCDTVKVQCKLCSRRFVKKKMRNHIGLIHIIHGDCSTSSKLLKINLIRAGSGGDPRIFENSFFPAYVPEKNKIITPCLH